LSRSPTNGNPEGAEVFRETLKGDCFAGACGTGDEAVAIGHFGIEEEFVPAFGDEKWSGHEVG